MSNLRSPPRFLNVGPQLLDIDTVGTDPWKDTKNPNHIKPGTLIRLGPVYHSPVLTEVRLRVCGCDF